MAQRKVWPTTQSSKSSRRFLTPIAHAVLGMQSAVLGMQKGLTATVVSNCPMAASDWSAIAFQALQEVRQTVKCPIHFKH